MKKQNLLLTLIATFISIHSFAQIKIQNTLVSNKRDISAVYEALDATKKYKLDFPNKLNYWELKMRMGFLSTVPSRANLKAKIAKKDDVPDITFKIITTGLVL